MLGPLTTHVQAILTGTIWDPEWDKAFLLSLLMVSWWDSAGHLTPQYSPSLRTSLKYSDIPPCWETVRELVVAVRGRIGHVRKPRVGRVGDSHHICLRQ